TAARIPQEAEPGGPAVGDERSFRVLAAAPVAPGIGVRMAGAQGVAAKTLRPVQADQAQPRTGRRAGVYARRLICERQSKFAGRAKTIYKTSMWRSRATSSLSSPA